VRLSNSGLPPWTPVLTVFLLIFVGASVVTAQERYMPGEMIVKLNRGVSKADLDVLNASYGVSVIEYKDTLDVYRLRIPSNRTVLEMVELYRGDPRVEYAEPNYMGGGGDFTPNDTFFNTQWYLNNMGQTAGRVGADIDAVEGWQVTMGSSSVLVAVLDTGIDFGQLEFAGRVLPGFDFVNNDNIPQTDHPHGVAVSGILAANADNAFGIAGVAPRVTLLPVKVLDANNSGTTLNLAQGLIFAAKNGAHVINMSLVNYPTTSTTLNSALQFARDAGAILIACAGNGGIGDADRSGPGASPLTIGVGATDQFDQRAGFSGTGAALDVVAPGVNLPTLGLDRSDAVVNFSGCSAATPVVSGITALLLSVNPQLSHDDIRGILTDTADDLVGSPAEDTIGRDDFFGHGRVSMNGALSLVVPDIVNDYITFEPVESTFITLHAAGCPDGFAGRFGFQAHIINISGHVLSNLSSQVTALTNGNLLRTPNGEARAVGARVLFPKVDGRLDPGEALDVPRSSYA